MLTTPETMPAKAAPSTSSRPKAAAIIICGPQGCGKTRNSEALAKHYGKTVIVNDWTFGQPLPDDAICLTSEEAFACVVTYRPPYSRRSCLVVQYGAARLNLSSRAKKLAPAAADIFSSAILASVKAAIAECPISASGGNNTSARTRAFASFLSGYLENSAPELAEAIFSLFKKA